MMARRCHPYKSGVCVVYVVGHLKPRCDGLGPLDRGLATLASALFFVTVLRDFLAGLTGFSDDAVSFSVAGCSATRVFSSSAGEACPCSMRESVCSAISVQN